MPRPKRTPTTENGRPAKNIDWDRVDQLLEAGCLGTEIASYFDVHPVTFYERVVREKGLSFTEYSTQKKPRGDAKLREAQYLKALDGDNTQLIWLGKNRLGQKDSHEAVDPEKSNFLDNVMDYFTKLQEADKNLSGKNVN